MRDVREIDACIGHRLQEELRRRLERAAKRLPERCKHNHQHTLDPRRYVEGERNPNYNQITTDRKLGLCLYVPEGEAQPPLNICEEPIDAQRCPLFELRQEEEPEAVYEQFVRDVHSIEWLREHLPDVHLLLWVLEDEAVRDFRPLPGKYPWYTRFWAWIWRIKLPSKFCPELEPVNQEELPELTPEILGYLPPAPDDESQRS